MDYLNSTTLKRAAQIMAPQLGLSLEQSKEEVYTAVNKYRNLLYNLYADVKLFDGYKVCCEVEKFFNPCNDPCTTCDDYYYGVTIPVDMAGVVAAWEYSSPLTLRSRWREAHVGVHNMDTPHLELIEMPETSPTERQMREASKIKVFTYNEKDHGKVVVIQGKDENKNPVQLELTLEGDAFVHSNSILTSIDSVVLPDLCGHIELKAGDCTLSIYFPHEHVPKYRRYKIHNCHGNYKHILIQGTKRYQDLVRDTDVVEIGDRLIMEAAARYFRYSENSTDVEDIQRAGVDSNTMRQLVDGIVARHRGRMLQDGSPVSRARRGKINSGLQGRRRRRW